MLMAMPSAVSPYERGATAVCPMPVSPTSVNSSTTTVTALSETVATRLGKMAAIDTHGGEVVSSAGALATYTELFEFLMYVGLGVGVFVLLVSPLLRRGMHGVH